METQKKSHFGRLLVEMGLVTEDVVEEALSRQRSTGQKLGEVLVEMGRISQSDIEWVLSKQLDIPFIIVDEASVDMGLLPRLPKDFLMVNRIVPMYETDTHIAIATDDPLNTDAFHQIEEKFNKQLIISTASGESIDRLLQKLLGQEGAPEFQSLLERLFERIKETCFYRLDFLISNERITVNAFGFGILKNIYNETEEHAKRDVFRALETMGVGVLYEEYAGGEGECFSIYPMDAPFEPKAYPAVLGSFGLARPEEITFADMDTFGLKKTFKAQWPVEGYDYVAVRGYEGRSEQVVYTIDSAPAEFRNCYVKAYIPRMCPSCSGAGCPECRHLGLQFTLMDGIYSYRDIMTVLKQER